jgi:hypothetical protein
MIHNLFSVKGLKKGRWSGGVTVCQTECPDSLEMPSPYTSSKKRGANTACHGKMLNPLKVTSSKMQGSPGMTKNPPSGLPTAVHKIFRLSK